MILYLHGFRSSPASFKAQMLEQALASRGCSSQWRCPQLPASPAQALELARQQAQELAKANDQPTKNITVVGSSLGGFYAVCLAEELGCKAVAINPAVYAPRELATQVGEHREYHADRPFVFLPEYVNELHGMARTSITHPDRYLLVAAKGDELLDWREMQAFFKGSHQIIIEGSDHGLSDFADHMGAVLAFAGYARQDAVD